jgi:methylmalonyl-CoA/ethylmalonyl-CoA epimerase
LDIDGKRVTEPFKFLIGISWIGEIQVELIQPVYGPMIYEAFIQKHGEGLHHFKERIR